MKIRRLKYALVLAGFLISGVSHGQLPNGWEIFEKTTFKKTFVKEYGMFMTWPDFKEDVLQYQGKEIMLMGYIIPTADAGGFEGVILSKYPYAMCFFCGEAGIESVAELRMKNEPPDFVMDKPYVFKGKLLLNDEDFDQLNFILTNVELMDL
ncbi:MAG: hypothetical protein AAFZ15_12105 [Bacteroidota bacterium]